MLFSDKRKADRFIVAGIALAWALFQLALPRLIILDSTTVRTVHLAFAVALVFLTIPVLKGHKKRGTFDSPHSIPLTDYILAGVACLCVLYFVLDWTGISMRAGLPIPRDIAASVILIVLLLEASRRAIGPAITIIAILFTLYAFLGSYMPMTFAFRGVSLRRYVSQMALSAQGIFGIPLHVSANTVFLFVLLGSMLERVGAGHFFNDLSLSLFGRFKGGAGKATFFQRSVTVSVRKVQGRRWKSSRCLQRADRTCLRIKYRQRRNDRNVHDSLNEKSRIPC
jgi:TRAP-type uncharacterized transport system fused permease subunit